MSMDAAEPEIKPQNPEQIRQEQKDFVLKAAKAWAPKVIKEQLQNADGPWPQEAKDKYRIPQYMDCNPGGGTILKFSLLPDSDNSTSIEIVKLRGLRESELGGSLREIDLKHKLNDTMQSHNIADIARCILSYSKGRGEYTVEHGGEVKIQAPITRVILNINNSSSIRIDDFSYEMQEANKQKRNPESYNGLHMILLYKNGHPWVLKIYHAMRFYSINLMNPEERTSFADEALSILDHIEKDGKVSITFQGVHESQINPKYDNSFRGTLVFPPTLDALDYINRLTDADPLKPLALEDLKNGYATLINRAEIITPAYLGIYLSMEKKPLEEGQEEKS